MRFCQFQVTLCGFKRNSRVRESNNCIFLCFMEGVRTATLKETSKMAMSVFGCTKLAIASYCRVAKNTVYVHAFEWVRTHHLEPLR